MINTIKTKRCEKGISQQDFAEALGVTQGAVSQWESGITNPNISLLPKMSQILGCTVDELLSQHIE